MLLCRNIISTKWYLNLKEILTATSFVRTNTCTGVYKKFVKFFTCVLLSYPFLSKMVEHGAGKLCLQMSNRFGKCKKLHYVIFNHTDQPVEILKFYSDFIYNDDKTMSPFNSICESITLSLKKF